MLKRILIIGGVVAIMGVSYAWRAHQRSERRNEALLNEAVPAMKSLSAETLADSDWSYSGPLGNLTLRFERNGKLVATTDATTSEGRWEIHHFMLYAYIPGADKPHQAIFRKSTDELAGISPGGMEPPTWSASRVEESK